MPLFERSRTPLWVGALILVAGLVLAPLAFMGGGKKPGVNRTTPETQREDELTLVRETLRRDTKIESYKTAAAQLNVYLSRPVESKPSPATESEKKLLANLRLTPDETAEVTREDFSTLDAHYLEESLLFRDAVASLKLNFADKSTSAALERARLAFAWAMRQTWLFDQATRPLPAGYSARLGKGTAAERAGVTLAVLQQVGLDAVLIGEKKDDRTLRSWAVGVLVDGEVYLFDPRAGRPVPAADGKGIATLKQARANPDLVKEPVGAADVGGDYKAVTAASKAWLVPPLSALAPRMRWLQGMLTFSPPVVLGIDPAELVERFAKAGEPAEFWNPPPDVAGPTRRLAWFHGAPEGGFAAPNDLQHAAYRAAPVPFEQMPAVLRGDLIKGDPREKMLAVFMSRFTELYQEPGKPRDLILRGQFDEATRALVELGDLIVKIQRRIASEENLEKEAVQWAEEMRSAFANWLRDKDNPDAKARVDALYKSSQKMSLLLEQSVSEPFKATVAYQTALCKHEQAERRSRDRSSPEMKRDAWLGARGWWANNFLADFSTRPFIARGQLDHARAMLAEVDRQLAALPK